MPHLSWLPPRLQAREGIKSRQILIDLTVEPDTGQVPLSSDSIEVLKGKVDKALRDNWDGSGDYKTQAVTRLRNRGVLIELESKDAVSWFADDTVRKHF